MCNGIWFPSTSGNDCSGRGFCSSITVDDGGTGFCKCDTGWTGRSSFINGEGYLCHINILSLRIIWGISLLMHVLVFMVYFPQYWGILKRFRQKELVRLVKQGTTTKSILPPRRKLRDHHFLLTMTIYFWVVAPLYIGLCLTMVIYAENQRIGLDFFPTFFWFGGRTMIKISAANYQPELLEITLGKEKLSRGSWFARPSNNRYLFLFVYTLLGGVVWVVYCFPGNVKVGRICWVTFSGGMSLLLLIQISSAYYLKRTLSVRLSEAHAYFKNEEILKVQQRMLELQKTLIKQGLWGAIMFFIFAAIPNLWPYYDYLCPVLVASISPTIHILMSTYKGEMNSGLRSEGPQTIVSVANKNPSKWSTMDSILRTNETILKIENEDDPNLLYGWQNKMITT